MIALFLEFLKPDLIKHVALPFLKISFQFSSEHFNK